MNQVGSVSVRLTDDRTLVAVADGRSWLISHSEPNFRELPASPIVRSRQAVGVTLVEAAILVGLSSIRIDSGDGAYTLERYIRWLEGNALFAAETPKLLRVAAARLRANGSIELAEFALRKAEEETGHAELAKQDLATLGRPFRADTAPPSAKTFVTKLRDYAESDAPIRVFGFSYCLERMALLRDERFRIQVISLCPNGSSATKFLDVHSRLGSDALHMRDLVALIEKMDISSLTQFTRAVFETAVLIGLQHEARNSSCSGESPAKQVPFATNA